jgi:type I restriction enzyme S subunit
VPEHWNIKRLKNIIRANITDGPHETPTFIDEGIPFLSVDGIQDGELSFTKCRYISKDAHSIYSRKAKVEKNDILLGKAASIGKVARVKVDFEFSIWSPLALIKPNLSEVTPTFLEYLLKSSLTQYQIQQLSTSNTQQNISMGDIPKFIFILPSIEEQTAIANFLDRETAKIDTLIEKQQRLITLLQEKRQAVISHAVTKGLDSNVKMKDSGVAWLGEVPEHWGVKKFKYLFRIKKRIAGKLGYDVLSITQKGIKIKDIASGEGQLSSDYSKYQIVKVGDFAMNHMDLLTGFVDLSKHYGVTSPDYRVFSLIDKEASPGYYLYLLQMGYLNKIFYPFGQGSSHLGRWRLPTEAFNEFVAPFPPYDEQMQIAEFIRVSLGKFDALIQKANQTIALLKERRTALISAAVTGKIDVRQI